MVLFRDCYRRTRQLVTHTLGRFGIAHSMVPPADLAALDAAIQPETRLVIAESPTNPYLFCTDLAALAKNTKARGRIRTLVDATFATPINCRPLDLGVDLVAHSATKYLAGHNDVLAGFVAGPTHLISLIRDLRGILGGVLDPHAAFLVGRGLKTLSVRVLKQNATALEVARFLEAHPAVSRVHYPGLPSHPSHQVAREQMRGFGGVVSFEIAGGRAAASRLVDGCQPRAHRTLPRRRGNADRAAGHHELLRAVRRGARRGGHRPRPRPPQPGHRGIRGPHRGSREPLWPRPEHRLLFVGPARCRRGSRRTNPLPENRPVCRQSSNKSCTFQCLLGPPTGDHDVVEGRRYDASFGVEAIRVWFLRDVIDFVERDRGSEALKRLGERLPDRLADVLDPATLRASSPTDTVPLATGEDALLSLDSIVGDGSGKLLEGIGREIATRFLSHGGAVMTGDLIGTLSRLRVPFEHPFVGVTLQYEIERTPAGFSMSVGATGHPRTTRILRHLATGAILAAQRYAREAGTPKLYGEVRGDRAIVDVVLRATTTQVAVEEPELGPLRRPSRPSMRSVNAAVPESASRGNPVAFLAAGATQHPARVEPRSRPFRVRRRRRFGVRRAAFRLLARDSEPPPKASPKKRK